MARTARELTAEELAAYRPWSRVPDWTRDPEAETRRRQAWEIAREVAGFLRARYRARRVLAFGSLVTPARFAPWSDIDLAVEGVAPEDFYDAAGEAADRGIAAGFAVTVIDLAAAPTALRYNAEGEGVEL